MKINQICIQQCKSVRYSVKISLAIQKLKNKKKLCELRFGMFYMCALCVWINSNTIVTGLMEAFKWFQYFDDVSITLRCFVAVLLSLPVQYDDKFILIHKCITQSSRIDSISISISIWRLKRFVKRIVFMVQYDVLPHTSKREKQLLQQSNNI